MNEELIPMEITMDTIRELRMNGGSLSAQIALNAFRQDVKKIGKQEILNCLRTDRRIKQFKGGCTINYCMNIAKKGNRLCEHCIELRKKYRQKAKEARKK